MGDNMNPFLLPEKERLLSWRELRNQITTQPESDKLLTLLRWWAKAPICAYSIDGRDCSQWPTPWELLNENMFCTSSIAYMMAQTLILSGFEKDRIELVFIKSDDDERLVVLVDGSLVLNYSYGETFEWADIRSDIKVRERFVMVDEKFVPVNRNAA